MNDYKKCFGLANVLKVPQSVLQIQIEHWYRYTRD